MTKKSVKRRLIKARIALNHTIQKILDINRKRKHLLYSNEAEQREQAMSEELRVLNKMAENQARLVRHYENSLLHYQTTQKQTQQATAAVRQREASPLI